MPESVAAILVDSAAPTPPLDDFLATYAADDNLWWSIGCGHHQNLLDEAVERLEAARADNERLNRDFDAGFVAVRSQRDEARSALAAVEARESAQAANHDYYRIECEHARSALAAAEARIAELEGECESLEHNIVEFTESKHSAALAAAEARLAKVGALCDRNEARARDPHPTVFVHEVRAALAAPTPQPPNIADLHDPELSGEEREAFLAQLEEKP